MLIRLMIALGLVALTLFCIFGFFATFEPPGFIVWKGIYGTVVLACLVGVVWVFAYKGGS